MNNPFPRLGTLGLALVMTLPVRAATPATGAAALQEARKQARRTAETSLKLDPARIINESSSFLKEREPEMSAEEYALYERVESMLATEPDLAIKVLEAMRAEAQAPSPAFEFILGNAYYAGRQLDKAEALYRSAAKRFPSFIRAWNNLGVLYYFQGKYAEAIPCFSRATDLGSQEADTFGLLGYCLEHAGDLVTAEIAYEQALARSAGNPDWMEGLLRVCLQSRQYGRAESLVTRLIQLNPGEARLWLAHANILLLANRKLEAMAMLESAVAAKIGGPEELELLADLYAEQELNAEAIAIYEKLLAASPDLGERKLLNFAKLLIRSDRLKEAEEALVRLKGGSTPGGRVDLHLARAELLAARQQWREARQELQGILQAAPLNGEALLALGRAFLAENNSIEASLAFEAAMQVSASTYRASLELANLELRNHRYDKCAEYLRKALALERTDAIEDLLAHVRAMMSENPPAS